MLQVGEAAGSSLILHDFKHLPTFWLIVQARVLAHPCCRHLRRQHISTEEVLLLLCTTKCNHFSEQLLLGARGCPPYALQVAPVAVVWFMAQYAFTLSLAQTSVTSNTILSSSSSMFTLLASALVLGEKITPVKLISVTAVMAGRISAVQQGHSSHASQP